MNDEAKAILLFLFGLLIGFVLGAALTVVNTRNECDKHHLTQLDGEFYNCQLRTTS